MLDRLLVCFVAWALLSVASECSSAQEPKIGGTARLESWKVNRAMAVASPYRNLQWQSLGPKFAGGRIESIKTPKGDLGTIYAGVGAGGVWKSSNGGLTWKPIFSQQSTFAIGDLAIADRDPNVLWVGTGECHLSGSSYPGNGVFKSIDGGEHWQHMGLENSDHIGKVVIDPNDENIVYVAAMGNSNPNSQRGVYKTIDGGQSFKQVLFEQGQVAFVDLVIDPTNPNRLYASAWDRSGGQNSGVFRSDDQGETWKRLAGGLLDKDVDRVAIDVSTSKPGVIYALMVDRSSPELARRRNASILFRSDDAGESWKRTHDGYVPTYVGWDFCDVRVAPDDENRIYVGGLRLIISQDGGKTFLGEGGFATHQRTDQVFRLHPHRGVGMHLDVHDIWIDPQHPERVMLGNDGGLYVSTDRGETWLHLNSLPIAEFYRIHLDHWKPFHIWGGTQDNASFEGPSTAVNKDGEDDQWKQVFLDPWSGGDGFSTFPDPHDPMVTYYTQQNGDLKRSRLGRLRPIKSIKPEAGESSLRFAWDTPFFASSDQPDPQPGKTVLFCAAQRVLQSTDSGDHWTPISADLSKNGLLALAQSSIDPKRMAAGGGNGEVFLTDDGGANWQKAGDGLPDRTIRDIVLSVHNLEQVYVVLSGSRMSDCSTYVYRSDDFGKTWNSIANNLPPESANALAEDPQTQGLIFLGTDLGVYVSTDGGKAWDSLCTTMPTAPVVDLAVHGPDAALVAATHGLSIFLLPIKEIRERVKK